MLQARRRGGPTTRQRSRMTVRSIAVGGRAPAEWATAEARPTAHWRPASRVRVESAIAFTSRRRRDRALVRATAWCASEQCSGNAARARMLLTGAGGAGRAASTRIASLSASERCPDPATRVRPAGASIRPKFIVATQRRARALLLVCEPLHHLHTPCSHWPARRLAPTRSLHTCTRRLARCTGLTLSDGPQSLRRGRSARLRCVGAQLKSL